MLCNLHHFIVFHCIFSERELTFAKCLRPSVCRLSVTFVRPTVGRLKFSAMFLRHFLPQPSVDTQVKFYGDRPRGWNPSVGGVKHQRDSRIQRFWTYRTLYLGNGAKQEPKLVLITNRKLHMSFRLVPNSVTLDDLEQRKSRNLCVISTNSVAF